MKETIATLRFHTDEGKATLIELESIFSTNENDIDSRPDARQRVMELLDKLPPYDAFCFVFGLIRMGEGPANPEENFTLQEPVIQLPPPTNIAAAVGAIDWLKSKEAIPADTDAIASCSIRREFQRYYYSLSLFKRADAVLQLIDGNLWDPTRFSTKGTMFTIMLVMRYGDRRLQERFKNDIQDCRNPEEFLEMFKVFIEQFPKPIEGTSSRVSLPGPLYFMLYNLESVVNAFKIEGIPPSPASPSSRKRKLEPDEGNDGEAERVKEPETKKTRQEAVPGEVDDTAPAKQ